VDHSEGRQRALLGGAEPLRAWDQAGSSPWRPRVPPSRCEFRGYPSVHKEQRGYRSAVGRFITRLRPGDTELQDQIWAEAHHLYGAKTPLMEAVSSLMEMAGDNPNAFRGWTKKNTKGLNRTPEGQAVMGLVGMASTERDASHLTGVRLTLGRHSPEEKSLASMPIADCRCLWLVGERRTEASRCGGSCPSLL
jgi:hypothetical protein